MSSKRQASLRPGALRQAASQPAAKRAAGSPSESDGFDQILARRAAEAGIIAELPPGGECRSAEGRRCTLCYGSALEYTDEVRLKNAALGEYWQGQNLPGALLAIVPSPRGRGYRTVSKRKVFLSAREVRLALLSPGPEGRAAPLAVRACAIEPREHASIYQAVHDSLQRPFAASLAESLQYVIVKGNYREFTVVLNVRSLEGPLLKSATALSKALTKRCPSVVGFFLFEDDSGGEYYMGSDRGRQPVIRRVFGKESIYQQVAGRHFLFSPLSFSQVNLSLAGHLVAGAGELLGAEPARILMDLYCGYGVFAVCLADKGGRVAGVELSPASVQAAEENAVRNQVKNVRFFRDDINGETVSRFIRQTGPEDAALLDPPRNGAGPGVIEAIAARGMKRIVHLFCNIDILGRELGRWHDGGYAAGRIIPFDMFPGTGAVELMVELTPPAVRKR